jgi:hypothetical protein
VLFYFPDMGKALLPCQVAVHLLATRIKIAIACEIIRPFAPIFLRQKDGSR